MKKLISLVLAAMLILTVFAAAEAYDWNNRYTYAQFETMLKEMNAGYSDISVLYPIGHTRQERNLWCLEVTNYDIPAEDKIGIGVLGNIHGGERESGACAMYFADWITSNSDTEEVKAILDNYIIYIVPVINPDGYEQSFVINTRQNLRPRDLNGDGVPFSDPYTDIDGDGYIATLYRGTADAQPSTRGVAAFGTESPDWDKNGLLGDDPRNSGIDMNRTFDYQFLRYDVETRGTESGVIGANSLSSVSYDAASEPEIQAIQNLLKNKPMNALVTLHTGEQSVLYPWCYRPYDPEIDNDDIPYMAATAEKMAAAFQETTGRGYYASSSWADYPTSAELIDYAYGRLNIKAYTIEVYCGGKSKTGDINDCYWENELPAAKWVFYNQEQLTAMGLDVEKIHDKNGDGLAEGEGLWFYTSSTNQMVDKVPEEQALMCEGCKDAILVMIDSEPYGAGYTKPAYLDWE